MHENTQVIDVVGIEKSTGKVVLTIADHLPWDGNEHLLLLQEKLNSYLAFIESGEIYESYPGAIGRQLVIDVVLEHWPNVEGLRHLELAKEQVQAAGSELRYRTLPGGRRHLKQFNGREGETATFLSRRPLNFNLHGGRFRPTSSQSFSTSTANTTTNQIRGAQ